MLDPIKKIKSYEWKHWVERPYGAFIVTLIIPGTDKLYFTKVGLKGFGYGATVYQNNNIYYAEEIDNTNLNVLKKYFLKYDIFDISQLLKNIHKDNKKKILKLIDDKKIGPIKKLEKAREILRAYCPFLWLNIPMERYYTERLFEKASKYIKGEAQKFIGEASIPKKKNEYGKMLDALQSGQNLEAVLKNFAWLKCRDGFSDFYTIKELAEIKKNIKKEKSVRVKIPKVLKKIFAEAQELVFFRTERTDNYYEGLGLARPIFKEVADYLGVSFEELEKYDANSIIAGKPKKYFKDFSYYYFNGQEKIFDKPIISFAVDLNKQIKGTPAYNGVVRGIARIIRHPSELGKIKKGEILITQMTLPSFISAMQKASAFVTDEGGITCHAAIIAREMKKPCIIGTRIATKVLHDGDLVEVDANKGIVKILSKK